MQSLIFSIECKNGWQIAEDLGDKMPYAVPNLLGRAVWDADLVRDDLVEYVTEHLDEAAAVLAIAETGFLKKGIHSASIARQNSGMVERAEKCQIGVFLSYASYHERTFLDRKLYLPKEWTGDPERSAAADIQAEEEFATKIVVLVFFVCFVNSNLKN